MLGEVLHDCATVVGKMNKEAKRVVRTKDRGQMVHLSDKVLKVGHVRQKKDVTILGSGTGEIRLHVGLCRFLVVGTHPYLPLIITLVPKQHHLSMAVQIAEIDPTVLQTALKCTTMQIKEVSLLGRDVLSVIQSRHLSLTVLLLFAWHETSIGDAYLFPFCPVIHESSV